MLSIHHYNVAVHDLDEAVANYTSRFGMQIIGERGHNELGNFDFQALGYDGSPITRLITPSSETSPVHRLMRERANDLNPHGEGMYMVAYDCDDVAAFCDQVEANGGRVQRAPSGHNAWVHPTASHFVFMEVVQRNPTA